jgi:ATP-dependent exoDNAse (exonuclease V) alpha subunit
MVSAEFFEKISDYLIYIRGGKSPFGGVKLILCGDMAQLPPIDGSYCFTSSLWKEMSIETIELTEVVRQIGDFELREILNEVRWGECSDETFQKLRKLKYPNFGEVEPTILYSKNIDVDGINMNAYEKLPGIEKEYATSYSKKPYTKIWAESLKIPESIKLKIGAQVILTYNLATEEGLVNGTRGMVTELAEEGPVVLFKNGDQVLIENIMIEDDNEKDVWIDYCPLRLAWAITIHKSQSMTISAAELDLGSSIFEYGQAYTALSRIQDSKSVKIKNIKKNSFKTHPDVLQFYNRIPKSVCAGCEKDFYWSQEKSHESCISS